MLYSQSKILAGRRLVPRKRPSQSRSAQTVNIILEGAARVLERRGFDGYTTNVIAERAGVSIGSLYQYFPSRDAVTVALIERQTTGLVIDVKAALLLENPREALGAMIDAAVRHQLQRPLLARLLDLEEIRLKSVMPTSTDAAAARSAIADFLVKGRFGDAQSSGPIASDVMAIMRALTDAAGQRLHNDPAILRRTLRGAVLGYLEACS